jgi:hypothetical protein
MFKSPASIRLRSNSLLWAVFAMLAAAAVADVRPTLEGPVVDTLTAVNHAQLTDGRFDLVAAEDEQGLQEYTQVERFFLWSAETDRVTPGETIVYRRRTRDDGSGSDPPESTAWPGFFCDSPLGRSGTSPLFHDIFNVLNRENLVAPAGRRASATFMIPAAAHRAADAVWNQSPFLGSRHT